MTFNYQPLESVSLTDVGPIAATGLTVVAGPNSSGKSQLLRDIESRLIGSKRDLVVCDRIKLDLSFDLERLLEMLCENGALKFEDGNYSTVAPHLGKGSGGWQSDRKNINLWHTHRGQGSSKDQFLNHFGQIFLTSLFLERRLTLCNEVENIDYRKQRANNELQALYINKQARAELTREIAQTFKKSVWVDNTRGGRLCLRVSDQLEPPSAEDRLEPQEMEKYRVIESEGDGLKSYVGICTALLVGQRPVLLVDEPEMCLHPPQAYALGKFIGRHAADQQAAVFVATHSSHILRGIIETTCNLRVLRLTHVGDHFRGELVPYETLRACIERPSTKAEAILDGVFAEAVTIVESEGDRIVYSATRENVVDDFRHDVHFVSVGGIGGIASTCRLYRELRIPQTVIADLDLVLNHDRLNDIVSVLSPDAKSRILSQAKDIADAVRELGPPIDSDSAKSQLAELSRRNSDWTDGEFKEVRKLLLELADNLSPSARLKRGGVSNLGEHPSLRSQLSRLISECVRIGLFLVPVGELEYWDPELLADAPSRRSKADWANFAASRIRDNGRQRHGIHEFVVRMCKYQQDEIRNVVAYSCGE